MSPAFWRVLQLTFLVAVTLGISPIPTSYAQDHHINGNSAGSAPKDNQHGAQQLVGKRVVFELTNHERKLVTAEDYRGNYLLFAFGFTTCTHVCPMMAATIAKVLKKVRKPALGIFVSVDTERDGPKITDDYAKGFHSKIIGLSGTYQQLAQAAAEFQATFVVTKSQRNYTVQHTAHIYLIDPQGVVVDIFALNEPIDNIIAAMP
jgi:protein SCO1/2